MKQDIPFIVPILIERSQTAYRAALESGEALDLRQNSAPRIQRDLSALIASADGYVRAREDLRQSREDQRALLEQCRAFLTLARDLSKAKLGSTYSQAWDPTGLVGSLVIPQAIAEVQAVLRSFASFLELMPDLENVQLKITAQHAREWYAKLLAMRGAVNDRDAIATDLLRQRNEHVLAMRRRLRGLVAELAQLIEPMDPHWIVFGFNRPGADETPEVPEQLEAVRSTDDTVHLQWEPAARAEYYRVWQRTETESEFTHLATVYDPDFLLVTSPVDLEVAVSAVNSGGESALSSPLLVRGLIRDETM